METPNTQYERDRRALEAILKALRENPIPLKYQKMRKIPGGGNKPFAKWIYYVRHLDKFAPNCWEFVPSPPSTSEVWYAEREDTTDKKRITGYNTMPIVSVATVLTIKVGTVSISRGSVGTCKATEAGKGLPPDAAKWQSFKKDCGLFGIFLERREERRTNDYTDTARRESKNQQNDPKPRSNNGGNKAASKANALITASAGIISSQELIQRSRDMFNGKTVAFLDSHQIDALAKDLGITM